MSRMLKGDASCAVGVISGRLAPEEQRQVVQLFSGVRHRRLVVIIGANANASASASKVESGNSTTTDDDGPWAAALQEKGFQVQTLAQRGGKGRWYPCTFFISSGCWAGGERQGCHRTA